jgi:hypothetical protein
VSCHRCMTGSIFGQSGAWFHAIKQSSRSGLVPRRAWPAPRTTLSASLDFSLSHGWIRGVHRKIHLPFSSIGRPFSSVAATMRFAAPEFSMATFSVLGSRGVGPVLCRHNREQGCSFPAAWSAVPCRLSLFFYDFFPLLLSSDLL